jgi:hypothetical protein
MFPRALRTSQIRVPVSSVAVVNMPPITSTNCKLYYSSKYNFDEVEI